MKGFILILFPFLVFNQNLKSQPQLFAEVKGSFSADIEDIAVYKGDLYIIGDFDSVDGVPAKNIARFDGSNWHSLPIQITIGKALHVYKDELYISGYTGYNILTGPINYEHITRWDGVNWKVLVDSAILLDVPVFDVAPRVFAEYNGLLYMGALFRGSKGFKDYPYLAVWNGNSFQLPYDKNIYFPGWVRQLETNSNALFIGGEPIYFGNQSSGIASLSGSNIQLYFPPFSTSTFRINKVIAGEKFLFVSHNISGGYMLNNGNWVQKALNGWDDDHIFLPGKIIFSTWDGKISFMDTSTYQISLWDSLGWNRAPELAFYDSRLIISNEDQGVMGLYYYDSLQVVSNLEFSVANPLKVYPNPTREFLTVENLPSSCEIQLNNMEGELIQMVVPTSESLTLNLEASPPGLYLLKIISEAGVRIESFVKN